MKRLALVALGAVALSTAALLWARDPMPVADDQTVSGDWKAVVALRNGFRYDDRAIENWVWKFDGHGGLTWEGQPPDLRSDFAPALCAFEDATEPKARDLKHLMGPHRNRITRGIYAFAGPELLINVPLALDGERPGGFSAEWFTGNLLVTLHPVRR
jgi:uncharacterized protein (TIGR03067 family)